MSESSVNHIPDELLHAYLDEELDANQRAGVRLHLEGCRDCSRRMETWSTLFLEIEQLPEFEAITDFEPLVLAQISAKESRINWTTWLILAQAGLAVSLMAYGWGQLSTIFPLESVFRWLSLPVESVAAMILPLLATITDAISQFFAWSPSSSDLIIHIPGLGSSTPLIYGAITVVLLWLVGNHYLLRINGQSEDVRT